MYDGKSVNLNVSNNTMGSVVLLFLTSTESKEIRLAKSHSLSIFMCTCLVRWLKEILGTLRIKAPNFVHLFTSTYEVIQSRYHL